LNLYARKQRWKLLLLFAALFIGAASLWYTNRLVENLSEEERKKVELWAEATRKLGDINDLNADVDFLSTVINNNTTIPVLLTDEKGEMISYRNLDSVKVEDPEWVHRQREEMMAQHAPILIALYEGQKNYIYYRDSVLLTKLRYYPYFQLTVIALFLLVSYLAFSSSRKAEQNRVWVGMAKETAHQLGTPLSSLMAWLEYLKLKGADVRYTGEIEKDLQRLHTITERFSKIGSAPSLKKENIGQVLQHALDYMRSRASDKVRFELINPGGTDIQAPLNVPLFEWVIENILKNAIDAMHGEGVIRATVTDQQQFVYVDISDTGKGISKSAYKTVFKPGYTTKNRGWGLGLSLSKRIIEEYHDGQIFVKGSEQGKGTTFRIVLKK
jgi:nitrogen-specific signal transduction histidine kinase